jgi:lipopolysaccharide/colanic/teichoic acid biosynthesis glycosyltransferase
MSLVGPRPLLVEYLSLYTPKQARRHDVRPGITGWAQVNGRNAITWAEKFELDVWYVDNHSLLLDLKILWMTLKKVMRGGDTSQAGHVTMPRFRGSRGTGE